MARPEKIRLGDMLVQQQLVTPEQLQLALEEQKRSGRKLGRMLVESGYVTEEGISKGLARQLGVDFVDLKTFRARPELVKLLPEVQARRNRALVLSERDGQLIVGMADPTDLGAFDELARVLKRDIDFAVVGETQLLATIDRVYSRAEEISGLAKELTADMAETSTEFGNILGLTAGAEDAPVVKLLNTVFEEALKMRASDIHIEPQEKSLVIRFRIDGVLHVQTEADSKIATALVLRLKLMSGLDISEKRLSSSSKTCPMVWFVDCIRMQILGGELLDEQEQPVVLQQLLHRLVELEILDDVVHVLRKAVDVIAEVDPHILRILLQPREIILRRIVKFSFYLTADDRRGILHLRPVLLVQTVDLILPRLQHTIQPPQDHEGEDDIAVFVGFEKAAEHIVSYVPDEGGEFLEFWHSGW